MRSLLKKCGRVVSSGINAAVTGVGRMVAVGAAVISATLGFAGVAWATDPTPGEAALTTVSTAVNFNTLITAAATSLAAIVVVIVGLYFGFLLIKKAMIWGRKAF